MYESAPKSLFATNGVALNEVNAQILVNLIY
jgi:hypothetical protein